MTRLLSGSRTRLWTTRGEYWLEASWITSSATEKAMPAIVTVAVAMVDRTARALSTVASLTSGSELRSVSASSTTRVASPASTAPITKSIGTRHRLPRARSTRA